jgi:hypothetical protein
MLPVIIVSLLIVSTGMNEVVLNSRAFALQFMLHLLVIMIFRVGFINTFGKEDNLLFHK